MTFHEHILFELKKAMSYLNVNDISWAIPYLRIVNSVVYKLKEYLLTIQQTCIEGSMYTKHMAMEF